MKKLIEKKTVSDFRETGLLFFINQILHAFGWVIARDILEDGREVLMPARTKYRGFDGDTIDKGYEKVNKYMKDNADEIYEDCLSGQDENNEEDEKDSTEYIIIDDEEDDNEDIDDAEEKENEDDDDKNDDDEDNEDD